MDAHEIEARARRVLEALWRAGQDACRGIWRSKPDVVIVLYHSGQSVLRAAHAVWDVVGIHPFPPVVGINFGREKVRALRRRAEKQGLGQEDIFGGFVGAVRFPNWAAGKTGWQSALQEQVAAACGSTDPPACALVLDDISYTMMTQYLAHSLLTAVYPTIKTLYVDSEVRDGWQITLGFWVLFTCFPELGLTAADDPDTGGSPSALGLALGQHLHRIVVGTEDAGRSSLAWRPLTAGNPHVRALRDHIPEALLLELSEWVYAAIEGYARDRAMQEGLWPPPSEPDPSG